MRKLALFAAAMMTISAIPAKAQVMIDMSLVTCKQFLDSDAERAAILASWMGGYFSASKNLSTVDLRYVERNTKKVINYCEANKSKTLMSAVEKNYR
ncbi:HdeA family protein [Beijerinckia indica]|uniref:Acid stress chaperone HdeB n=1 Tax=Beijerinckia indica subsp. indica (strain ATCC 9039 / DSM 1715 / NCIMB 8712) TaxID=395963 RepID=B2ICQ5_BEII9|nr:HdeA family protein [Beijerinckia indica]ACB95329.1 conserved hypothetical protein [Beijerinckia indica subsp. indica ATCC 9039]